MERSDQLHALGLGAKTRKKTLESRFLISSEHVFPLLPIRACDFATNLNGQPRKRKTKEREPIVVVVAVWRQLLPVIIRRHHVAAAHFDYYDERTC